MRFMYARQAIKAAIKGAIKGDGILQQVKIEGMPYLAFFDYGSIQREYSRHFEFNIMTPLQLLDFQKLQIILSHIDTFFGIFMRKQ